MKATMAVLAGMIFWAVLWIGTNQVFMSALPEIVQPNARVDHMGVLWTYIAVSVVLSIGAGWITARVRGGDPMSAVWVLALIQLLLGIFFEISAWDLLPVWYHIVFLALIVPATVYGGAKGAASG